MRVHDLFREDEDQPVSKPAMPNPEDRVSMDVPLLLRIMEYAREDAKTDMDLHVVADRMVKLSGTGNTLGMQHYNQIVPQAQHEGDAAAEKLIHDVEYDPDDYQDDEEDVQEGYGRYWCSTDKRWKERKGPKQSRS